MNNQLKTYKEFLNESVDQSRFPLIDPQEVKEWIENNLVGKTNTYKQQRVTGEWSVDEQGYVSCTGSIDLSEMRLNKLPFRIKFTGNNLRFADNQLTSLKGLESLESVGGDLWGDYNNLTSLKGLENLKSVGGEINFGYNQLQNFEGLKNLDYIGTNLNCFNNFLTSFEGLESLKSIGKYLNCRTNKLLSKKVPFEVKRQIIFETPDDPYKYEDSVSYLVSLSEEEQENIIEDLMDLDPQAYRKLLTYAQENKIELPVDQGAYKWNKEAQDLEDTGLEF
jgi:hypothetical protein